jgi:cholesterol transport system auxiliary component
MRNSGMILAGAAALALSGCVSFGPKPPKSLLTLTAAKIVAANSTRTAAAGQTITILYPTAPVAITVPRIPVYDGNAPLSYVVDAAWNDTPVRLFQHLLSETVAAQTGRIVLDLRQYTLDPGLRISGQLQNFGIDARTMQAVVTYDALIVRAGGKIETRRFEARVPVARIDAASVGAPLNQAANMVAGDVATWIGGA